MLGALNGGTSFIEQRVSAREIPVVEGIKRVLARFDRVVVVVWMGLGVVGEPSMSDLVLVRISATPLVKIPLKLVE